MFRQATAAFAVRVVCIGLAPAHAVTWDDFRGIERTETGFRTTAKRAWMISQRFDPPVPAERYSLLIEVKSSQTTRMHLYWMAPDQGLAEERSALFTVRQSEEYVLYAVNLSSKGTFDGLVQFHLRVADHPDLEFDIRRFDFVTLDQVPAGFLADFIGFSCYTSKLHYRPGERIEYRVALNARYYPDRESSKVLAVTLKDDAGRPVASAVHQYGLRPMLRFKEIQGVLDVSGHLSPGRYTLEARSVDQRSGFELASRHDFGVQGQKDPFVCETPFKFVKDFSWIKGPDGRWHVFSITGDFFDNHDWTPDGQERTFSHASSSNLRDWTIHPPVISISNETYPDGREAYKNRNVWAPHVIEHSGRYWMFYTSVNRHGSQSISLATSPDLFDWSDYDRNPVFTPEGADWANWGRDCWGDCRDPIVLKDGQRFYLYATINARPPGESGAVGVAESADLIHWSRPEIAVRGPVVSESPQVWKMGETYCMTTSSHGAGTFISDHPVRGWKRVEFPRPDIRSAENYVKTSNSYAEEVLCLDDGSCLMAALTFRHWGNSIYFFRVRVKDDRPVGYASPF